MLDAETKRRIDTARDILVGKLPDPKSQVEQITIALIYKFMDDMDKESEELGGKPSFFTGEFSKYSWSKIFDPRLGGYEIFGLYTDAIQQMNQNKNIPQLFRDIFKNAYLPYRDPETLKSFLKVINDFHYYHSEKLGDAFEYLLSIMGSQGEAGQFRTPRHIIDFIVTVVEPKKNETILDPACGTAGFLISSYKHILKENTKNGKLYLTPDEKKRLIDNFVGYDISPDMVRLSLVNMYLHGFKNPHIFEYDTLTSEERWNDVSDVIMANPPFMTPKGGIKPHKKFSTKAKRSEVLFVDYIAEHLNPNGRAGIIVPEGIIFQSANAYKALRKMLLKSYLWAVVSLPTGVFNPYSGVKTSILLLDKNMVKRTNDILFVKIENDGFDLGAQRREIKQNDLPDALRLLQKYKTTIIKGKSCELTEFEKKYANVVSKEKIAKSGDYNLSGDRYKESKIHIHKKWPTVNLGEIAKVISGQSPGGQYYNNEGNGMPFYQGKTEFGDRYIGQPKTWTTQITKVAEKEDILMSVRAPVGPVNFSTQKICIGRGLAAIRPNEKIEKIYLFNYLKVIQENIKGNGGTVFDSISREQIQNIKIPLPPLSVQKEIVAEIEGYQKIIDGAKQVVENYKPVIKINPEWKVVELGEMCELEYGFTDTAKDKGNARLIRITDIDENGKLKEFGKKFINLTKEAEPYLLKQNDILVARTGATYGKTMIFKESYPAIFASYLIRLKFNNIVIPDYYWIFSQSENYWIEARTLMSGGAQQQFNANAIKRIKIPIPSISEQKQIIGEIEEEQKLVETNMKLIEIFKKKIKDKIDEVWGGNE